MSSTRLTGELGRNLPAAVLVGVGLAMVCIGTLFWSHWAFLVFVALIIGVALHELDGAMRASGLRPATPVALGAGLVMFFGAYAAGTTAQTLGLVLLVLGTLGWALWEPRSGAGTTSGNIGATLLMAGWVPFLASFIGLLLAREDGSWAVLAVVALAVTNDVGAFAFGSRFGRRKLAPRVSPAKSWEGFAGGLASVLVLALAVTAQVPGFTFASAVALGAGVAIAGTLGDLAESLVKRDLGVKDLGHLLPGHGGVMDRVDALLFALPVGYLVLQAFPA